MVQPLSSPSVDVVLSYLNVQAAQPDLSMLDRLVAAYTRTVPWESASRIARRAKVARDEDCPRWPEEFWLMAMDKATGGTCYESNYAFFSLLTALGYKGYLTINDMGALTGCHSAIIIYLDNDRWLVDVGLPLYAPLPIPVNELSSRATPFVKYTLRLLRPSRYQIEREPHPRPICFTLIDEPVDDATYRKITMDDYGANGLFLDHIIINKVIDEHLWRFNSAETPYHLEMFENGARQDTPLEGDVPLAVARHFGMDEVIIREAFSALRL